MILVRAEQRGGVTFYELTHDRLVEPILANNKKWEDETSSPLQRQSTLWKNNNENEIWLLQDKALEEMEQWAKQNEASLTELEQEFLDACRSRQQNAFYFHLLEQATEWDKHRRNKTYLLNGIALEEAERWIAQASAHTKRQIRPVQSEYITASRSETDRRQRTLLAGVSLALVISIVLSIFAWFARNDAKAAQVVALTSESRAVGNELVMSTAQAIAEENQMIAEQKKLEAEEKINLAIANRSALQSQIAFEVAARMMRKIAESTDSEEHSSSLENIQTCSSGGSIFSTCYAMRIIG